MDAQRRVWEAGHFYVAMGPTTLSQLGWQILSTLAEPEEHRMLFVDDVHKVHELHPLERDHPVVAFDPQPEPHHIVTESGVLEDAQIALEELCALPNRDKRARKSGGKWRCAGFTLTDSAGYPLCLLFDLGLTRRKRELGFTHGVNILPWFYELEQRRLLKLAKRMLPDFRLDVVLFDPDGRHRRLDIS